MTDPLIIGFIGAGKMATALARGFIKSGLVKAGDIFASDSQMEARQTFIKETGAHAVEFNRDLLQKAKVIIVAVKPETVMTVLHEIYPHATASHLFISIAAGLTLTKLESGLPKMARVIRVMPNTPALVGASATGYSLGSHALKEDDETAGKLFSSVGVAFAIKESLLDAVTGLSGSGPAYIYTIIEAMSDGGVASGLPREIATKLAAQTVLGSARMVLETGIHPGALKDMVTSPGGTTIEGLHELEKGAIRATMINAVRAATEKSKKLGQH